MTLVNQRRVLVIAQGAPGGIGRYEVMLAEALSVLAKSGSVVFKVLSKESWPTYLTAGRSINFQSARGARISFACMSLLETARCSWDVIIISHVNLAQLAPLFKLIRPATQVWVIGYGIEIWEPIGTFKRLALRRANCLLAISAYTRDRAVEATRLSSDRTSILPCALPPGHWSSKATKRGDDPEMGPTVLLSVCRLAASERYKGVDTVIEALPRVLRHVPDVEYVIAGTGDDLPRLQELAEEKGVGNRVRFLGTVDEATLMRLYSSCSVFVLPSEREGFGIVFLEAMAARKAVIGGRHGGTPEVVDDGRTGLLVDHGDLEGLTSALITLLTDAQLRQSMGDAGFREVLEKFTFEHFVANLRKEIMSCGADNTCAE